MKLTEEELEQATYDYENASIIQKKQWAETFRQKFGEKNEEKLKQLTSSNQQTSEMQKAIADKYNAELDQFSQQIVNKEVYEQISSKTKSWTAIEPEKSIFYDKTDSEIK
jgi:hypothetical protein